MRKMWLIVAAMVVLCSAVCPATAGDKSPPELTEEMVTELVEKVCAEVAEDAAGTFEKIIAGEHPYKNKDNPAFYVFVYNTDVEIVAHPKKQLVGRSYKGKPDVKGKNFRDLIVEGAVKNGSGWENYHYQKPGAKGIHPKTAFFKLVKGSDGKDYAVVCGKYGEKK